MTRSLMLAALVFALWVNAASAQQDKRRVERADHVVGTDRFVAGGSVLVREAVAGDLIAAGGEVDVLARVGGDTVLAGGRIRLDGQAGQDVYAAGGRVSIDAPVARNARIAGGSVELGPRGRVAGAATLAGGRVNVLGPVQGYLQVAGGRVYIDAAVGGDAEAAGGRVELGPNARIGGTLRYGSDEELIRHPDAQVRGAIERFQAPHGRWMEDRPGRGFAWALFSVWTAGMILLGVALVAAFPHISAHVAQTARRSPGWSLLLGFIGLVMMPLAAALIAFTLIGLPLALLLGLAYFVVLLAGFAVAGIALGDAVLLRSRVERAAPRGRRLLAAAVGILVLALLALVPYLGPLIAFLALIIGMGAMLLQLRRTPQPA